MIGRLAAGIVAALALTGAAQAQSREDRGAPSGSFDFYVLALSWSASFCDLTGKRRGSAQCEEGRNPGFVVHGLWPQYERGYPAFCRPEGRNPSRAAIDEALRVFPEAGLARHEWQKHGTCSGENPSAYFDSVAAARARVKVPEPLVAPATDREWRVLEIERAFAEVNPGLRPDMLAVTCKRGLIEEVRICFTRDLRGFRHCEEVDRDSCRAQSVTVPAAR